MCRFSLRGRGPASGGRHPADGPRGTPGDIAPCHPPPFPAAHTEGGGLLRRQEASQKGPRAPEKPSWKPGGLLWEPPCLLRSPPPSEQAASLAPPPGQVSGQSWSTDPSRGPSWPAVRPGSVSRGSGDQDGPSGAGKEEETPEDREPTEQEIPKRCVEIRTEHISDFGHF